MPFKNPEDRKAWRRGNAKEKFRGTKAYYESLGPGVYEKHLERQRKRHRFFISQGLTYNGKPRKFPIGVRVTDDPLYQTRKQLKDKYGLTLEAFQEMFRRQGGRCAICAMQFELDFKAMNPLVDKRKTARVDHCHKAGHARGLLCNRCNLAIGNFDYSIRNFKSAIKYLSREALFNGEVY